MGGFITAVGIILSFIVGLAGLIISLLNTRKTLYINTVTASRIKWIGELRALISEFVSIITLH